MMDGVNDTGKKGLTSEHQEVVSELGEVMHSFYQFKPQDRNRIIDGIHSLGRGE